MCVCCLELVYIPSHVKITHFVQCQNEKTFWFYECKAVRFLKLQDLMTRR